MGFDPHKANFTVTSVCSFIIRYITCAYQGEKYCLWILERNRNLTQLITSVSILPKDCGSNSNSSWVFMSRWISVWAMLFVSERNESYFCLTVTMCRFFFCWTLISQWQKHRYMCCFDFFFNVLRVHLQSETVWYLSGFYYWMN